MPSPERTGSRSPTRFARIATVIALLALAIAPSAVPAATPQRVQGAIVVVAGDTDTNLLRQAGVTHIAVELTPDNLRNLATSRWDGFVRGGFHVARDTTQESIRATAATTASLVSSHRLAFLIEDTEAHKADLPDGVLKPERLQWTEWMFAELRSRLGGSFPLYNITSGIHSSPTVVNHDAFRRHNVTPIWEAYDANGVTLGVAASGSGRRATSSRSTSRPKRAPSSHPNLPRRPLPHRQRSSRSPTRANSRSSETSATPSRERSPRSRQRRATSSCAA